MTNEGVSLGNLKGEVEVLRELVLLLLAQLPDTPVKSEALSVAQSRSRGRHPDLSPLRIATDHAWNEIAPQESESLYRKIA